MAVLAGVDLLQARQVVHQDALCSSCRCAALVHTRAAAIRCTFCNGTGTVARPSFTKSTTDALDLHTLQPRAP